MKYFVYEEISQNDGQTTLPVLDPLTTFETVGEVVIIDERGDEVIRWSHSLTLPKYEYKPEQPG